MTQQSNWMQDFSIVLWGCKVWYFMAFSTFEVSYWTSHIGVYSCRCGYLLLTLSFPAGLVNAKLYRETRHADVFTVLKQLRKEYLFSVMIMCNVCFCYSKEEASMMKVWKQLNTGVLLVVFTYVEQQPCHC